MIPVKKSPIRDLRNRRIVDALEKASADTEAPKVNSRVLTVASKSANSLTITWESATDNVTLAKDIRYEIYLIEADSISCEWSKVDDVKGTNTFTITGLKANTRYGFYVKAYDQSGNAIQYPSEDGCQMETTSDAITTNMGSRPSTSTGSNYGSRPSTNTGTNYGSRPSTSTGTNYGSRPSPVTRPASSGRRPSSSSSEPQTDEQRRKAINDYLRNLIFTESDIQEAIDQEDRRNRMVGDYLVRYEEVNIQTANSGTEMLCSSSRGDIYPGMLLVVDKNLGTEVPTQAFIPRGEITINIPAFLGSSYIRTVKPDANGNLQGPVNQSINEMISEYAKTGRPLVCQFADCTKQGESLDELSINMNCSAKFKALSASAGYERKSSEYSMHFMTDYSQVFFEVRAELPYDLSTLFEPNVTVNDIQRIIGANKTILFVNSVKYGRRLYALETIHGSNQSMIQSAKISYSGLSMDEKYTKSKSSLMYEQRFLVEGGDVRNADVLFKPSSQEEAREKLQNSENKPDPTPLDICRKQIEDVKKKVEDFKKQHTSVNLITGETETDINGVILSYRAKNITGVNPKDVTFWQSGPHKVKRLVRKQPLRLDFFNCLKATDINISGFYVVCDSNGEPLYSADSYGRKYLTRFPFFGKNVEDYRIVKQKSSMPSFVINLDSVFGIENSKNYAVHSVYVKAVNRRTGLTFEYTYSFPSCDMSASWLRPGTKGGDIVNWFSNGSDDSWSND